MSVRRKVTRDKYGNIIKEEWRTDKCSVHEVNREVNRRNFFLNQGNQTGVML